MKGRLIAIERLLKQVRAEKDFGRRLQDLPEQDLHQILNTKVEMVARAQAIAERPGSSAKEKREYKQIRQSFGALRRALHYAGAHVYLATQQSTPVKRRASLRR